MFFHPSEAESAHPINCISVVHHYIITCIAHCIAKMSIDSTLQLQLSHHLPLILTLSGPICPLF